MEPYYWKDNLAGEFGVMNFSTYQERSDRIQHHQLNVLYHEIMSARTLLEL